MPTGRWKVSKDGKQVEDVLPLTMRAILARVSTEESTCLFRAQRCRWEERHVHTEPHTSHSRQPGTRASGASELSNDDDPAGFGSRLRARAGCGNSKRAACIWAANNNHPWCGAWLSLPPLRSTFLPLLRIISPPRRHWGVSRMPSVTNNGNRPLGGSHARAPWSAATRSLKIVRAAQVADSLSRGLCLHLLLELVVRKL